MGCCSSLYGYGSAAKPFWLMDVGYINQLGSYIPKEQIRLLCLPDEENKKMTELEACGAFIEAKWISKICLNCRNNSHDIIYYPCKKCWLVFYCSERCQKEDAKIHHDECQNSNLEYSKIRDANKICIWEIKKREPNSPESHQTPNFPSVKMNGKKIKFTDELKLKKII